MAAARAAAEAAMGPGVLLAGPPAQSGPPTPVSESWPPARAAGCRVQSRALFGVFCFLVLGALGPRPLLSSYDVGSHAQFLQVSPPRSLDESGSLVAVSCSVKHRPVCFTERPHKAEEMKV